MSSSNKRPREGDEEGEGGSNEKTTSPTSIAQLTSPSNQPVTRMGFPTSSPSSGNNNSNNSGGGSGGSPPSSSSSSSSMSERDRDRERDREREREREKERERERENRGTLQPSPVNMQQQQGGSNLSSVERLPSPFEATRPRTATPTSSVVSPKMKIEDDGGSQRESLPSMQQFHFPSHSGSGSPPHVQSRESLPPMSTALDKPGGGGGLEFNISRTAQQIQQHMMQPSMHYGSYPSPHSHLISPIHTPSPPNTGGGGGGGRSGSTGGYNLPSIQQQQQQSPPQQQQQQHPQQQSSPSSTTSSNQPPQSPSPQTTQPQPINNVQHQNAFTFLEQVKKEFSNQPQIYNQFLDIMKDLKAHNIDTAGVIHRVTELFSGHPHLISGFNAFLPAEYRIDVVEQPRQFTVPSPTPQQQVHHNQIRQKDILHQQKLLQQQKEQEILQQKLLQQKKDQLLIQQKLLQQQEQEKIQQSSQKRLELDHARNYVKKIKDRFANQPHIYRQFLEVLHNYQREQQPIREVYEQVAELFKSHTDLLQEFTHFLPDQSNPPQMPPQISQPPNPQANIVKPPGKRGGHTRPGTIGGRQQILVPQSGGMGGDDRMSGLNIQPQNIQDQMRKKYKKPGEIDMTGGSQNHEEVEFFNKVRQGVASNKFYNEFLKCLSLFSQDIITRTELVLLVKDILLPRQPLLYEWFKQFIGVDDQSLELLERQESVSPGKQNDFDFSVCKRLGPSYRALPKNYPQQKCSGRTELSASVLNDVWVSFPTGSEDFGFKSQRKNQFEEILFKCEDERFELDLIIELNISTIKVLDPMLKTLSEMNDSDKVRFRMPTLDVLHHRSIERLYGGRGEEMLTLMYQNPMAALPIIIKRLKQKDQEWTKAKREWNKVWKETTEKNYYRSLDYQSTYFKQSEKKTLTSKVLLAEIRQKYTERIKERDEMMVNNTKRRSKTPVAKPPPYHLLYSMTDFQVCSDISNLICFAADKMVQNKQDIEKIENFLNFFLLSFFYLNNQNNSSNGNETNVDNNNNNNNNQKEKEDVEMKDQTTTPTKEKESNNNNTTSPSSSNGRVFNLIQPKLVSEKEKRVFLGNNTFYIFLRLYQILYERLYKAFELAESAKQAHWTSKPNVTRFFRNISQNNTDQNNESIDGLDQESGSTQESELDEKERYDRFLKCLMELIANNIDQSHYEDQCRSYLGISSYIVFTLDKLINQLTKQLQSLLISENCLKLLYLFTLEVKQPNGWSDSLYQSKVIEVLKEDRIFLFEFETKAPSLGAFTIQLLDPTSPSQLKHAENTIAESEKMMQNADQYMDRAKQYVNDFKQLDSSIDPRQHKVFLLRNIPKNQTLDQAMVDTINETGLECRICTQTFRLFYVEDTEDFFYRNGSDTKSHAYKGKKIDFEKIKKFAKNPIN